MKASALSDKARSLSKKYNVTPNFIINHFFFDAVLWRLSLSRYNNMFVLKGGYLLSIQFGILTRTTNDLDFLVNFNQFSKERVETITNEILKLELDDAVAFELKGIEKMKDSNGFRIKILSKLENIKQLISIDIATGDVITPGIKTLNYHTIIHKKPIRIKTYPYETIIAEKLQTIVYLGTASSRIKDLFDLYVIGKIVFNELDNQVVQLAINETFTKRNTPIDTLEMIDILIEIQNSVLQKNLWINYEKKNCFASGIDFQDLMSLIIIIVKRVYNM